MEGGSQEPPTDKSFDVIDAPERISRSAALVRAFLETMDYETKIFKASREETLQKYVPICFEMLKQAADMWASEKNSQGDGAISIDDMLDSFIEAWAIHTPLKELGDMIRQSLPPQKRRYPLRGAHGNGTDSVDKRRLN